MMLGATKMMPEQVLFPRDQNEKFSKGIPYDVKVITDATLDLAKESSNYLKSWQMTDVLQNLADEGILINIRGKEKIKQLTPRALPRARKGDGYEKSKKEGYYSVYKISDDLATLNKVISNPKAMKLIHNQLRKYEEVHKFFVFKGLATVYALMRGNERMFQLLTVGSQAILNNNKEAQKALRKAGLNDQQIQHSLWEPIKNYLLSLKEEELEELVKGRVQDFLENPIDHSHLLLYISRS